MTAETIREIIRHQPFEPFRVVMSSGESYNVMHPEMALVTTRSLILALPDPTHSEGERLVFCSYLHVAHVEVLRPSGPARRAG
jgi:hypothetical protein